MLVCLGRLRIHNLEATESFKRLPLTLYKHQPTKITINSSSIIRLLYYFLYMLYRFQLSSSLWSLFLYLFILLMLFLLNIAIVMAIALLLRCFFIIYYCIINLTIVICAVIWFWRITTVQSKTLLEKRMAIAPPSTALQCLRKRYPVIRASTCTSASRPLRLSMAISCQ